MKVVAIVQARTSSKRLPNKVLLPLSGKPVIEHVISRLENCKLLDEIIVATSNTKSDQQIVRWCKKKKKKFFTGSLNNVLDRYYKTAKKFKADIVVRVTADCPVIDPEIVDEVINGYLSGDFDLFSLGGEFPDGLDCQVFKFSALKKSWMNATSKVDQEHVGTFIEKTNPQDFKIGILKKFKKLGHHRWTLDEKEDYLFLTNIFNKLYSSNIFLTSDILNLLKREPNLMKINNDIVRNEGYLLSIKKN